MGSYTDNLGLYKVNTETDGNDTFNIDTMMNDNWDIIDAFSKGLRMKTYTNLSQIGLTAGSETIESILTAMPVNSILYVEVGASNADIYPTQYGMFIARKLSTSRWFAEFYPKETADMYVCSAKIENSAFTFYDWEKKLGENVTAEQIGAISKTLATFDDANDVTSTGFYGANLNAKNLPSSPVNLDEIGVLIVSSASANGMSPIYQIYIVNRIMYFRYGQWAIGGRDWKAWQEVFGTASTIPISSGGTGANTESKARENLKTDMILIDGYSSLGLSDSDFGATNADFVNNIVKIVNGVDSDENFLVAISDSTKSTSNLAKCIQSKIRIDDRVTFLNAYYSMYIYGRNNTEYPITVDVAVDNGGTPYMYRCVIGSTRGSDATRKASNFIPLIYGIDSELWGSSTKPSFTYKGDGTTGKRLIETVEDVKGDILLISSTNYIGFVRKSGGIFFSLSDGTNTILTTNDISFDNTLGSLTIKTDNDAVNKLNVSYKCQVL